MEGMERFSYYGFRAILTLYFVSLNLRESSAAAGFMFTSALAYAAPLVGAWLSDCLLYTSPSPRDRQKSRMPSSA